MAQDGLELWAQLLRDEIRLGLACCNQMRFKVRKPLF
jgi:hypothetical protein